MASLFGGGKRTLGLNAIWTSDRLKWLAQFGDTRTANNSQTEETEFGDAAQAKTLGPDIDERPSYIASPEISIEHISISLANREAEDSGAFYVSARSKALINALGWGPSSKTRAGRCTSANCLANDHPWDQPCVITVRKHAITGFTMVVKQIC